MTEQETSYPPATWRLIVDGPADGATNMAIDEAILSTVVENTSPCACPRGLSGGIPGNSPPTLRFYSWSPPCLSLGRNQPLTDVDHAACRAAGIDVVRRPTGGRAILHTDELTYSVVLPQSDPRATEDVVQGYRLLSEGLLAGFHYLGAETAEAQERRAETPEMTAVCFETPSAYEITARPHAVSGAHPHAVSGARPYAVSGARPHAFSGGGGRKLVGSAQWRARGGVLQHGTLPLEGDITRIVDVLAFSEDEREEQRRALRQRATTLEGTLGRTVHFLEVAQAMADGFAQALNLTLVPGDLTARERALVTEYRSRYAASALPTGA